MNLFLFFFNAAFLSWYVYTITRAPARMVVLRGTIEPGAICVPLPFVSTFMSCVSACGRTTSCQLSFFNGSCQLCNEAIYTVAWDKQLIGVRNTNNTVCSSELCAEGKYFMKYVAPGSESTDGSVETFNTSPSTTPSPNLILGDVPIEDDVLEISSTGTAKAVLKTTTTMLEKTTTEKPAITTPKKSCPGPSWKMFRNSWCLLISYKTQGVTQSQALKDICKYWGTTNTLGGMESEEELNYVKQWAKNHVETFPINLGIWIDGMQKTSCSGTACFSKNFVFTDYHLQSFAGYEWIQNSTGHVSYGGPGSCLQLMVPLNTSDSRFGKITFANCNFGQDNQLTRRAVLCGTPAI